MKSSLLHLTQVVTQAEDDNFHQKMSAMRLRIRKVISSLW